ncbi:MAG: alpha/beta hydrolase [Burkholderiaceae bacterium]|nr:alpha/beta hydrolase [Burkholderiaceae bacterium]
MPHVTAKGARLYYEEAGSGRPIVFVHEFGADLREWEQQVRWFSREYRCIAFNARGYPPSDVPDSADLYGYEHSADDVLAVLDGLGVDRAHIVGLSMGAYATLQFGLRHPARALSLVAAGVGSGAPYEHRALFKQQAEATAQRFLDEGSAVVAEEFALGANRVQLLNKDPRGWKLFKDHLAEHSAVGSAHTLRQYQAIRPSLYDYEKEFAACRLPTLLIVGDEDEPCLDVNLFLKRTMPTARLWMLPATGHAVNLEEPAAFNAGVHAFLSAVDRGCWKPRDPRASGRDALPMGKPE